MFWTTAASRESPENPWHRHHKVSSSSPLDPHILITYILPPLTPSLSPQPHPHLTHVHARVLPENQPPEDATQNPAPVGIRLDMNPCAALYYIHATKRCVHSLSLRWCCAGISLLCRFYSHS
ncbi:hypothetical protein BDZ45DRAFT_678689 [Acephala macrosclerotiorum]|nr:hypothetical protein BDZ45DRAFT_678689 [Acephala macrosclerotiorum]